MDELCVGYTNNSSPSYECWVAVTLQVVSQIPDLQMKRLRPIVILCLIEMPRESINLVSVYFISSNCGGPALRR